VSGAVTYVFSPKYALSAAVSYDFGNVKGYSTTLLLTRMGRDVQVSVGLGYNAALGTINLSLEILPTLINSHKRVGGLTPVAAGPIMQ
jgi:hypothetical protein